MSGIRLIFYIKVQLKKKSKDINLPIGQTK